VANPLIRYRAHITGWTGSPALFTQYFDGGATPSTAEGTEAGARVRAMFESIKTNLTSLATVQYDTGGDLIDPASGALVGSVGGATPANTVCSSAGAPLPWEVQLLVDKFTAGVVHGRRIKGRSFIPAGTVNMLNAGNVSSGTQTTFLTAANLLSTLIVTAITPVVWHRPKNGAGGLAFSIAAYSVPGYWSVLRSRRD
jgi:hypothetical protein